MLITKEQQESWVSEYLKGKSNNDEYCGFIDGINKALDVINEKLGSVNTEKDATIDSIINLEFKLFDKYGTHIGNEYHEANKFGVIQLYHQSLRGDWVGDNGDKKLIREGFYIPHVNKIKK